MQGVYWLLTIPQHEFIPYLPPQCVYIKGQLEQGQGGFIHWQVLVVFQRSVRLNAVRNVFGPFHAELTRSSSSSDYVWKEDTRIAGTQFEIGKLPHKRNCKRDWDVIWEQAKSGDINAIDKSVLVPHYNSIKRIMQDHLTPCAIQREVFLYWGATGLGKSKLAWEEAGFDAYPKDPRTKFWDGYQGHEVVVIDEFRGAIDISHLLRWFDRYPVIVEIKGSSIVLKANKIFITSNLYIDEWYPNIDKCTIDALKRRIKVTHFLPPL